MKKDQKAEYEQKIEELTADLQRVRADFENYRKRTDAEKEYARASGKVTTVFKILPIIDDIERAISHLPKDLEENEWAKSVQGLNKSLQKHLSDLEVTRIKGAKGTEFNPEIHEAVLFDDADGDKEVIAEEMRAGYMLGEDVIRPTMVKVTKVESGAGSSKKADSGEPKER